ncbi:hypothetical protein OAP28_05680 [Planktomarina sp.]|nr:hypothetical protein [Planktomarina sp.]
MTETKMSSFLRIPKGTKSMLSPKTQLASCWIALDFNSKIASSRDWLSASGLFGLCRRILLNKLEIHEDL